VTQTKTFTERLLPEKVARGRTVWERTQRHDGCWVWTMYFNGKHLPFGKVWHRSEAVAPTELDCREWIAHRLREARRRFRLEVKSLRDGRAFE
jgi:hypothetical protein